MKAYAVTNERGYQLFDGFDIHRLRVDHNQGNKQDVWSLTYEVVSRGTTLRRMIGHPGGFDFLANFVVRDGYDPSTICTTGRCRTSKQIITHDREYRTDGHIVHVRKR